MVRGMGALRCSPRFTAFSGCGSKDVRCKVPRRNLRESWQIHQIPITDTLKLTASKAPWNFDAWEVGTWNFLFLGQTLPVLQFVSRVNVWSPVPKATRNLKYQHFKFMFYQKTSPTLAFISCIWTNLMIFSIYFIYFGLWNSGLQFFERNTSAEVSLGVVSGFRATMLTRSTKNPSKNSPIKNIIFFLSNRINLSFFF